MSRRTLLSLLIALLTASLLVCAACDPAASELGPLRGTAATTVAPVPKVPCTGRFESEAVEERTGSGYVLELDPAGDAPVGKAVASCVRIRPTEGYKVNLEYPFQVAITLPEGVEGRKLIKKGDAEQYDEKESRVSLAFLVKTPGEKSFVATVRFSVCSETVCETPVEELAWKVTAK